MNIWYWWVKGFLLPFIENWQKLIEIRPVSLMTSSVCVGDIVVFNDRVERRIKDIRFYSSLEQALRNENPNHIWPGKSREEILHAARMLYPEVVLKRGVYVFELQSAD